MKVNRIKNYEVTVVEINLHNEKKKFEAVTLTGFYTGNN